jgi:hypothetical protein
MRLSILVNSFSFTSKFEIQKIIFKFDQAECMHVLFFFLQVSITATYIINWIIIILRIDWKLNFDFKFFISSWNLIKFFISSCSPILRLLWRRGRGRRRSVRRCRRRLSDSRSVGSVRRRRRCLGLTTDRVRARQSATAPLNRSSSSKQRNYIFSNVSFNIIFLCN